uniref:RNB domain-containing protein n=1 Tax=Strombidium rassoulzadegani TaxID=1082188 RepID=A0A7S3CNJ9_9SPIT|mmetsp:Transcript_18119/g.30947  ORF Transcript_18119/g.30947 Transcript_18119/m.30947 type:complete len:910 (+) Transcript_18119:669-3398(+)
MDLKLQFKILKVFQFYQQHFQGLPIESTGAASEASCAYILTDSSANRKSYLKMMGEFFGEEFAREFRGCVLDLNHFIALNHEVSPELSNYFGGFEGEAVEESEDEDNLKARGEESKQWLDQTSLFEPHLSFDEMVLGVKQGRYFQGRLNVSRLVQSEASIKVQGLDQEILLQNYEDQNRALNGDIVCVELLGESEWLDTLKGQQLTNALLDDNMDKYSLSADEDAKSSDDEERALKKNLVELVNSQTSKQVTGRVRGVLKPMNKTYGGSILKLEDMRSETKQKLQLLCRNRKMESEAQIAQLRLFVPYNGQLPMGLMKLKNPEALERKRLIVRFKAWEVNSPFPQCQFVKIIGEEGKIGTETNMILHEFNVDMRPFPQKVLDCLPKEGRNWLISPEEEKKRWDLRHLNVCSVDPPGCKDIDDALHCIVLPNGNYQIGVHIADVTHFVRSGTEIDREAARRCTTVYMVDRRTDMLPSLLTESLCSLVCHVDRCAFSVLFEIDSKTFRTIDVQFGKSIIRSRESLSYYKAQDMIDDPADKSPLTEGLRGLLRVATVLRDRRNENGALTLSSPEVKFKLDNESQNPTDVSEYKHVDAHYMIEEFMLLANIAVAEKIAKHFPSFAVLRRHPKPKEKEIQDLSEQLAKFGFDISVETSKKFAESLDLAVKENDPFFNKLIRIMATRCMNQAVYFPLGECDPNETFHYGLAVTLYTHFTSPIRRYADVLVHRLLAAAIDITSLSNDMTDKFKLSKQCDQMNRKNRMAMLASQASIQFNTFLYFKNQPREQRVVSGIVMRITQQGVYVLIQRYGIEGLLVEDNEKCKKIEVDVQNEEAQLTLVDQTDKKTKVELFDHLQIEIRAQMVEFRRSINLHFLQTLNLNTMKRSEEAKSSVEAKAADLSSAIKSKSKKHRK